MPKREAVRCGLPFRGDGSFRPLSFVALVVEIDVDAVFRHADVVRIQSRKTISVARPLGLREAIRQKRM